ncbi:MAG: TolC family protein [Marinifilaceae bacterium]
MNKYTSSLQWLLSLAVVMLWTNHTQAQQSLSLPEALQIGVANYETVKSKKALKQAAADEYQESKMLYLPDMTISAQQYYGTANALHGPQYGFGEGITSTGMPQMDQNWDAAFSSLYLTNFNWNVYAFGTRRNSVKLAKYKMKLAEANLDQEVFEHQVKIASAYLNLTAIVEIIKVQQENVYRAEELLSSVKALIQNGVRPHVELSTAQAELAGANIALLKAQDKKSEILKEVTLLLGVEYREFVPGDSLASQMPLFRLTDSAISPQHPALVTQNKLIDISNVQNKLVTSAALPKLNFVASAAGRASGFEYNYAQDNSNLSHNYANSVGIQRGNYLLGVNLSWNITSLVKSRSQSSARHNITQSLDEQRNLTSRNLSESFRQATEKLNLARAQYTQVLKQTDASLQAYNQYHSLYKNGLVVIDDVVQAQYNLARAESDRAVIQVNIWQAFLMQVASKGDIDELVAQLR